VQTLDLAVALFLLLNLGADMWREIRDPTAPRGDVCPAGFTIRSNRIHTIQ